MPGGQGPSAGSQRFGPGISPADRARALEAGWEVAMRFAQDAPVAGLIQWVEGRNAGGVFAEAVAL